MLDNKSWITNLQEYLSFNLYIDIGLQISDADFGMCTTGLTEA